MVIIIKIKNFELSISLGLNNLMDTFCKLLCVWLTALMSRHVVCKYLSLSSCAAL